VMEGVLSNGWECQMTSELRIKIKVKINYICWWSEECIKLWSANVFAWMGGSVLQPSV
jgi:hypothetical protein